VPERGDRRLRRRSPLSHFSQTIVISNGAKRNENGEALAKGKSFMRQFEMHPKKFNELGAFNRVEGLLTIVREIAYAKFAVQITCGEIAYAKLLFL